MAKKGSDEKRTALSLGAAGLALSGASGAAHLLGKALMKPGREKMVPYGETFRLGKLMGFPEHLPEIMIGAPSFEGAGTVTEKMKGRKVKFPRGWVELPIRPDEKLPLGAAAHEFGHARGGKLQRGAGAVSKALFMDPKAVNVPAPRGGLRGLIAALRKGRLPGKVPKQIMTPALSPLHIPLLMAAVTPKSDDKVVKFVQEHPAEIAAAMSAVPIARELHASTRGLKAIKKIPISAGGGWAGVKREMAPMGKGLASHVLGHLPAIAAILVGSKIRDLIQNKKEEKIEKKASVATLPQTIHSGGGTMESIEESFLSGFVSTLDKIAEGEYSPEEMKKMEEEKEKKKKEGGKKEGKKEKEEEGQTKEGSLLSNLREKLGLDKEASAVSGLREKLGLDKTASAGTEEGAEPEGEMSAFDAWKSTL